MELRPRSLPAWPVLVLWELEEGPPRDGTQTFGISEGKYEAGCGSQG